MNESCPPELLQARQAIDAIDSQILALLEARLLLAADIADIKDRHQLPLTDPTREREMIEQLQRATKEPILQAHIPVIFEQLTDLSKAVRQARTSNLSQD
jgi:chorismate mutase/prephenate dehydratase